MSQVMLALGDFRFSVSTVQYQTLSTSMSWRWASKDRYKHKPGKQFHGPGTFTKSLDITVYPENRGQVVVLDRLRAMADTGKPFRLVSGGTVLINRELKPSGADLGLWVIESLSIADQFFMVDGTPLERKGSLSISEYGEDEVS